jgi:hypothetical protein
MTIRVASWQVDAARDPLPLVASIEARRAAARTGQGGACPRLELCKGTLEGRHPLRVDAAASYPPAAVPDFWLTFDRLGVEVIESKADFARRLSISRQRVGAMVSAGLPTTEDGRIDVEAGIGWVKAHIVRPGDSASGGARDGEPDLVEARRRRILGQVEYTAVMLAKERGELVSRAETKAALSQYSRLVATIISNFPARYGQNLASELGVDPRIMVIALEKRILLLQGEVHGIARSKSPPTE